MTTRARYLRGLVLRRTAVSVPILLVVTLAMFALGAASPFDPAARYLGDSVGNATTEDLERIRHNIGADQPFYVQWWNWLTHAVTGDLGDSLSQHQPVLAVISERLGWTLLLVTVAFVVTMALSLVTGALAAIRHGGWFDRAVTTLAYAFEAVPVFWLSLAMIWLFSLTLRWFPAGGVSDVRTGALSFGGVLSHLVMPAVALAVSQVPWFVLYVKQSVRTAMAEDYVVGARARGLRERTVLVGHVVRGALLPFITLVGSRFPELITGAVLVETTFSWPGVAAATTEAGVALDFPLLAALTTLATAVVLLGNLLADVVYAFADPRVVTG
ncbi:ABC transporter permease [Kutzneria viridogrisea]|uniref:Peptide/nickel transport system permease protein n=1 Tax=Kutzneria viridogrisea TaxID=47990 RepID=A0ABR6BTX9_9PSEU|nr:peptide/nickel transport system permease protein [Kutzneria viridogrisea]